LTQTRLDKCTTVHLENCTIVQLNNCTTVQLNNCTTVQQHLYNIWTACIVPCTEVTIYNVLSGFQIWLGLFWACSMKFQGKGPTVSSEAVVLDNCTELYLSENSGRLESDLDSSLTCGWQSYISEQTSSYRQWCIPPSHRSSSFLRQMPLFLNKCTNVFSKINQESLSCSLYIQGNI
jgi:hypothetical protein